MVVENRQSYYKYSSNGSFNKQDLNFPVENHKKKPLPFVFKALGIGCFASFVGLIIILYVYQYVQVTKLNYEIRECQAIIQELDVKSQNLRLKIAQKTNLKEIDDKARTVYGMVDPEDRQYIALHKTDIAEELENSTDEKATGDRPNIALIVSGVADWFKNLTSVEAGTLD